MKNFFEGTNTTYKDNFAGTSKLWSNSSLQLDNRHVSSHIYIHVTFLFEELHCTCVLCSVRCPCIFYGPVVTTIRSRGGYRGIFREEGDTHWIEYDYQDRHIILLGIVFDLSITSQTSHP